MFFSPVKDPVPDDGDVKQPLVGTSPAVAVTSAAAAAADTRVVLRNLNAGAPPRQFATLAKALTVEKPDPTFYEIFAIRDEKTIKALEADKGPHGIRYAAMREELRKITQLKDRLSISLHLIQFLKLIFDNALIDFGLKRETIQMELCVGGSLAKNFATPYSDIDCFIILGEETDDPEIKARIEKLKRICDAVFNLCNGFFKSNDQFLMDPFGINIKTLQGSVKALLTIIQDRESGTKKEEPENGDIKKSDARKLDSKEVDSRAADISALTISVCNAKSVFGQMRLLGKLQAELDWAFKAKYYFDKAVVEYPGPNNIKDSVNLKSDIFRPIDFMLQGFRKQLNLSLQEFNEPKILMAELVKRGAISDSVRNLIEYIQEKAYAIRYRIHTVAKREHDEVKKPAKGIIDPVILMEWKEVTNLVALVGWLRGSLVDFLKHKEQYVTFDLLAQSYLSNGDPKDEELIARLGIINTLKNTVYASLRTVEVIPDAEEKSANLPDTGLIKNLNGYFEGFPPLTGAEVIEVSKKIKNPVAKLTGNAHVIYKALEESKDVNKTKIVKDILYWIGSELDANKDAKSSDKRGNLSRVFNLIPNPYGSFGMYGMIVAWELQQKTMLGALSQAVVSGDVLESTPSNFKTEYQKKMRTWLKTVVMEFVFPEILDSNGHIKEVLWDRFYFSEFAGKQKDLSVVDLEKLTNTFISGVISMTIGGQKELHRKLLPNTFILFTRALTAFVEQADRDDDELIGFKQEKTFIEEMVIRYSIKPICAAIKKRNDANGFPAECKDMCLETPCKITDLNIFELRKLKNFLKQGKTEFNVIAFIQVRKMEKLIIDKYNELKDEDRELAKDPSKIKELENRFEKNYLLYRAMVDIEDVYARKLTLEQLEMCFETYVNYVKTIPAVRAATVAAAAVGLTSTETTSLLIGARDQLKLLLILKGKLAQSAPQPTPPAQLQAAADPEPTTRTRRGFALGSAH